MTNHCSEMNQMEMACLYQRTYDFVKKYIQASPYPEDKEKQYRLEHTLRVAAIGKQIANQEGMEEVGLVLGCLLHDVGKYDAEKNIDHGRASAKVARPFLVSLGLEEEKINEICYGIAIHVDGKADFDHPFSVLAESISDCDNIDRFDVYRVFEMLRYEQIETMSAQNILKLITPRIKRLEELQTTHQMATSTATKWFQTNLSKQLLYYRNLEEQMKRTSLLEIADVTDTINPYHRD